MSTTRTKNVALEVGWDEAVKTVRGALLARRNGWLDVAETLSRVERKPAGTTYRWLREFAHAKNRRVDGGRLARLAGVLGVDLRITVDLPAAAAARAALGRPTRPRRAS